MPKRASIFIFVLATMSPAQAQQVGNDDFTFADGLLVTTADVTTCPYRLLQSVQVNTTEDYGRSREKVHSKFRKEARKMGADAVVLVKRGDEHMTAFAWTRREYHGNAIRYVDKACAPSSP